MQKKKNRWAIWDDLQNYLEEVAEIGCGYRQIILALGNKYCSLVIGK